jgi:hypothetical protein
MLMCSPCGREIHGFITSSENGQSSDGLRCGAWQRHKVNMGAPFGTHSACMSEVKLKAEEVCGEHTTDHFKQARRHGCEYTPFSRQAKADRSLAGPYTAEAEDQPTLQLHVECSAQACERAQA